MDIHIRRGRRTDHAALAELCAWPQPSKRMYRRTVSDLAYDLYVAEHLGEPVGVVAVSYVRELGLGGQRATLEELLVRPDSRGKGVGRRLLEFAVRRARRRGARRFEARPADETASRFLDHVGLKPSGGRYACGLADDREGTR